MEDLLTITTTPPSINHAPIPYLSNNSSTIISVPELNTREAECIIDLCSPRTPFPDYPCSMRELLLQLYREDIGYEEREILHFTTFSKCIQDGIVKTTTLDEDYLISEGLFYWKIRGVLKLLTYITTEWNVGYEMLLLFQKVHAFIEYRVVDVYAANILSRTLVPDQYTLLMRRLFLMELLFTWKSDLDDLGKYPFQPILIK